MLEMIADCHHATVCLLNLKKTLFLVTWNVRTLIQNGNFEKFIKEMDRMKINTLGISEMRWPCTEKKYLDKHRIFYSE